MENFGSNIVRPVQILEETYNTVNNLLKELKASNSGYLAVNELLTQIQGDIQDTRDRAGRQTIRIGILGGRGSGKSTLANALMGADLLPDSAIIFCTSIPTSIEYGKQYSLEIMSDYDEQKYSANNISTKIVKEKLSSVCKESENPQNEKKITKISLNVPNEGLHGKEIVDLPGFTKGNPLHQAFAESYAKYYCDACLVLINNAESVEIKSREGLDALVYTFGDRLSTTAFVINKCDESKSNDINFIESNLRNLLPQQNPHVFQVSAKNIVRGRGRGFQWRGLSDWLTLLTSNKILILVKAFLDRLISNLSSLQELCKLTGKELDALHQTIDQLLNIELAAYKNELWKNLEMGDVLPISTPKINLDDFNLPNQLQASGPQEYGKLLAEKISLQSIEILNKFVQTHQAMIFESFNARFEKEIEKFGKTIQLKVTEVESKFGVTTSIQPPKVRNWMKPESFTPSSIEQLKPLPIRVWLEKSLPGILVRDIVFWQTPITMKVGSFSIKLGIPIGIKPERVMIDEVQKNVEDQALKVMNEYVFDSIRTFFIELEKEGKKSVEGFTGEWELCLTDYLKRIDVAKSNTSDTTLTRIQKLIEQIRKSSIEVGKMISEG